MRLDSQEQIKRPKEVEAIEAKDKQALDNRNKSKKKSLFKIFLSIFIFILLISIGVLLFFLIKKKSSKVYVVKPDSGTINSEPVTLVEFQKKLVEEKHNSITAVYSLQKDEESVFFNPKNIGLSDKNYEIEVISVKDEDNNIAPKTLRHLEDISYKFLSQIN